VFAVKNEIPVLLSSGIRDVSFGSAVKVVEPTNLYGCTIGDNCFIGPFVEIQKDVTIGKRTRIQSHSFICELVSIGDDCFVGHGVMFVNDTFSIGGPARGQRQLWRSTTIGDRVSIGSNATIMPVEICSDVVIGAGAVVVKPISKPGIYAGNPAKFMRAIAHDQSISIEKL
jgi:acetyltransferase-like isoleucine patch superfamily enzyme